MKEDREQGTGALHISFTSEESKQPVRIVNAFGDDLTDWQYDAREDSDEEVEELARYKLAYEIK